MTTTTTKTKNRKTKLKLKWIKNRLKFTQITQVVNLISQTRNRKKKKLFHFVNSILPSDIAYNTRGNTISHHMWIQIYAFNLLSHNFLLVLFLRFRSSFSILFASQFIPNNKKFDRFIFIFFLIFGFVSFAFSFDFSVIFSSSSWRALEELISKSKNEPSGAR